MATGKNALLQWCKQSTEGYNHVKITNFHMSWANGLAFCALIHAHRPELFNYDVLRPEDKLKNMELAFSHATKLGIPALLEVEDMMMVTKPEPFSVMTYLSQFYHFFKTGNAKASGLGTIKIEATVSTQKRPASSQTAATPPPTKRPKTNEPHPCCIKCTKPLCGKVVEAPGGLYHEACFGCSKCGKKLNRCVNVNGKPFCDSCGRSALLVQKKTSMKSSAAAAIISSAASKSKWQKEKEEKEKKEKKEKERQEAAANAKEEEIRKQREIEARQVREREAREQKAKEESKRVEQARKDAEAKEKQMAQQRKSEEATRVKQEREKASQLAKEERERKAEAAQLAKEETARKAEAKRVELERMKVERERASQLAKEEKARKSEAKQSEAARMKEEAKQRETDRMKAERERASKRAKEERERKAETKQSEAKQREADRMKAERERASKRAKEERERKAEAKKETTPSPATVGDPIIERSEKLEREREETQRIDEERKRKAEAAAPKESSSSSGEAGNEWMQKANALKQKREEKKEGSAVRGSEFIPGMTSSSIIQKEQAVKPLELEDLEFVELTEDDLMQATEEVVTYNFEELVSNLEGYLFQRNKKKKWTKRFFMVSQGKLCSYASKPDVSAVAGNAKQKRSMSRRLSESVFILPLQNIESIKLDPSHPCGFLVHITDSKDSLRVRCEKEDDVGVWIGGLYHHINTLLRDPVAQEQERKLSYSIHDGFLQQCKKGIWKKYWFCLRNGFISCYQARYRTNLKRTRFKLALYDCQIEEYEPEKNDFSAFRIVTQTDEEIILKADDSDTMLFWINAILKEKFLIEETINTISIAGACD